MPESDLQHKIVVKYAYITNKIQVIPYVCRLMTKRWEHIAHATVAAIFHCKQRKIRTDALNLHFN